MLSRRNNNNDNDDESSLSTPPLPIASDHHHHEQFIKAEPMSPSAAQHRHVTSGQGHRQGQGQCETQGHRQGQGQTGSEGRDVAAMALSGRNKCESQHQKESVLKLGQGRKVEAAALSGNCQGYIQGHLQVESPVQDQKVISSAVLSSLLGDDTSCTSLFPVAAASSTSASSSVFETDLSADTVSVVAKHARLELNPCATEWHPLE